MGTESPFQPGEVVVSKAGRDKGRVYFVLAVERNGYVKVADGSMRTARKPKRKNVRHLTACGLVNKQVVARLGRGRLIDDELLRRALAAEQISLDQGESSAERG